MSEADAVPHGVTRAEFPALSAVLSGYFHQDFDLDHPDWASAVAEIASDLPWGGGRRRPR